MQRLAPGGDRLSVTTAEPEIVLRVHRRDVRSLDFSPGGDQVVTASEDATLKRWRLQGRLRQPLAGHAGMVNVVSFTPDGTIASASGDRTIKFWQRSGDDLSPMKVHASQVSEITYAPDGETLATAGSDGTIKLWDAKTSKELQILRGHSGPVHHVSFSPDGQTLASASFDRTVKLWNVTTGKEIQTLEGHRGPVQKLTFDPKGQTLASVSNDGTIILWNLNLEDLMGRSCRWLADYMANPATPTEEKALCKGYLPVSRPLSFWAPWHWLGQVRVFWQGLGVPLGGKSPSLGELRPSRADAEQGPPEDKLAEGVATRP